MRTPRVLCIVLSGGQGSRLGPLTTGRAKASLPVGGHYRLIDVSMSNAAHSGVQDVWVLEQYEPHLLNEHLSGGRPWDLDRTRGGFRTLPPFEGHDRDGWSEGNADALARNWSVIDAFSPDVLLVVSADHLLQLDLRSVVAAHSTPTPTPPSSPPCSRAPGMRRATCWSTSNAIGCRAWTTSPTSRGVAVASAQRCSPTDRTPWPRHCATSKQPTGSSATTGSASSPTSSTPARWLRWPTTATGATSAHRRPTSTPSSTCCATVRPCAWTTRPGRSSRRCRCRRPPPSTARPSSIAPGCPPGRRWPARWSTPSSGPASGWRPEPRCATASSWATWSSGRGHGWPARCWPKAWSSARAPGWGQPTPPTPS